MPNDDDALAFHAHQRRLVTAATQRGPPGVNEHLMLAGFAAWAISAMSPTAWWLNVGPPRRTCVS